MGELLQAIATTDETDPLSLIDFGDRLSVFAFALGASVVLFIFFWWCLITTSPLVEWLYRMSRLGREGGDIDWVNSSKSLFASYTPGL